MTVTTNYFLTAATLKAAFTTSTRDNGETFHHLIDGVPDEVTDFVRECHDGEMPNDWRYEAIVGILQGIIETDPSDVDLHSWANDLADAETETGTALLLRWYADNCNRVSYIEQAKEEGYVAADASFFDQMMLGQYQTLHAMASLIINRLVIG